MQKDLFHLYHGKKGTDTVSHKNDFLQGQGIYGALWEVDENSGGSFILNPKYHKSPSKLFRGKEITRTVLEVRTFTTKERGND